MLGAEGVGGCTVGWGFLKERRDGMSILSGD
jgi:hypothetical protein